LIAVKEAECSTKIELYRSMENLEAVAADIRLQIAMPQEPQESRVFKRPLEPNNLSVMAPVTTRYQRRGAVDPDYLPPEAKVSKKRTSSEQLLSESGLIGQQWSLASSVSIAVSVRESLELVEYVLEGKPALSMCRWITEGIAEISKRQVISLKDRSVITRYCLILDRLEAIASQMRRRDTQMGYLESRFKKAGFHVIQRSKGLGYKKIFMFPDVQDKHLSIVETAPIPLFSHSPTRQSFDTIEQILGQEDGQEDADTSSTGESEEAKEDACEEGEEYLSVFPKDRLIKLLRRQTNKVVILNAQLAEARATIERYQAWEREVHSHLNEMTKSPSAITERWKK
jgi:hypothetical protein